MKVVVGDLWEVQADFKCIPTNGNVRQDGTAVMGRGVALQAAQRYPEIPEHLGQNIRLGGNSVHLLPHNLFSFPTKHHWWEKADLTLIRRSAEKLKEYADESPKLIFAMPLPGVGNGGRSPEEIWPLLE